MADAETKKLEADLQASIGAAVVDPSEENIDATVKVAMTAACTAATEGAAAPLCAMAVEAVYPYVKDAVKWIAGAIASGFAEFWDAIKFWESHSCDYQALVDPEGTVNVILGNAFRDAAEELYASAVKLGINGPDYNGRMLATELCYRLWAYGDPALSLPLIQETPEECLSGGTTRDPDFAQKEAACSDALERRNQLLRPWDALWAYWGPRPGEVAASVAAVPGSSGSNNLDLGFRQVAGFRAVCTVPREWQNEDCRGDRVDILRGMFGGMVVQGALESLLVQKAAMLTQMSADAQAMADGKPNPLKVMAYTKAPASAWGMSVQDYVDGFTGVSRERDDSGATGRKGGSALPLVCAVAGAAALGYAWHTGALQTLWKRTW